MALNAMMIAIVAVIVIFGISYHVMVSTSEAAQDRMLAEQARKLAGASQQLSGPGSMIKLEVNVPKDSILEILPGSVGFHGKLASASLTARTKCSLLLEEGSYTVTLGYDTCSSDPAPLSSILKASQDWSDGMSGWYSRWASAGVAPDHPRSGDHALLVSVPSPKRWAGVITSWSNLVQLKPNTVYIAEVYVYVPGSVKLQGKWEFHRHVYDILKRCSKKTCHHYTILEGDYRFDDSIPRDRWVRKWIKFKTWSDAGWFRAFFVTSYPYGSGTVYWDDFALWEVS